MHLPGSEFFTSSLVVEHNALKNIIFRIATITLDFAIMRIFGLLAFWQSDYTSFLMFGETVIQKAMFISSRGVISRQSLFLGVFALIAAAGESYDTMLWAIDNPGFVVKHRIVNGASLVSQIIGTPAYVIDLTANNTSPSTITSFGSAVRSDLFATGLNYSLPGIVQEGTTEVVPPLYPLNPLNATARIWLDDEGFAVGLDFSTMTTVNMTRSLDTLCVIRNDLDTSNSQIWNCNVPNGEAEAMLDNKFGIIPVWWDSFHIDQLQPNDDNPWSSLASGGGTLMMKQVFTVTKGVRRHTFKSTVTKASMSASAPNALDNGEITDFMRRTWSPDGTITTAVQGLIDVVLQAKGNSTGRTFGQFIQTNTSLLAMNTDYLNFVDPTTGGILFSMLRFILTNTTLIRSETLAEAPTPFEPCPGTVYRNTATGGKAISSNCNIATSTINQTIPLDNNLFLGQLDTSTVGIFTGLLGDGSSNVSAVALSDTGVKWLIQEQDHVDNLLISRALLLGGNSSAVGVDVVYNAPAISVLQLVLSILPSVLAILAWLATRSKAMKFYQSSFLAAVLTTTRTIATPSEKMGHGGSMPEITLEKSGRDVTLRTPYGGTITNTVAIVEERDLVHEPLVHGNVV